MKKITYITNIRMPTEKAHGVQIAKMCEAFSSSGAELELIVPRRKNSITDDPYSFYGIKKNFRISYVFSIDVIDKFSWLGYWIQLVSFSLSIIVRYIFASRKKTFIYTREFMIAFLFRWMGFEVLYEAHRILLKKNLFFFFLKPIKKIVTNSRGVAFEFTEHGFKKVLPLNNGIDLLEFTVSESKESIRKRLNLPQDKKIALYSGYLYKWKGIDTVVSCAEELSRKDPEIFFVIVGGDRENVDSYRTIIQNKNLKNIDFIGQKERKMMPFYQKAADVLLLPNSAISEESIKYTSPIKLSEYMASGVPIVSSDMPSLREVLNEKNAILVPPDNPEALANGILKIVYDSNLSENLGKQAYEDVRELTWEKRAGKILAFLNEAKSGESFS